MFTSSAVDPRRSLRILIALLALVGVLTVSACSSDSTASGDTAAEADGSGNAGADADAGDDGGNGGGGSSSADLPDGFPDVPLPEFTKVDVIKHETDTAPGWNVMFTVDETLALGSDQIVTDYASQLEAAGYALEGDATDPYVTATQDETTIVFHSAMDGTITIGVTQF